MNRTAQKKLKQEMEGCSRAEIRRVRKGHAVSAFAGAGHGKPKRVAVKTTESREAERSFRRASSKIVKTLLGVEDTGGGDS